MLSTIKCSRGDVMLARFVFAEGSGAKIRPVVVVNSQDYHMGRQEAIVVAITSNTERMLVGDLLISDWRRAGLLFPSVATGIIRTIKRSMIARNLGRMSSRDLKAVEASLRSILKLA